MSISEESVSAMERELEKAKAGIARARADLDRDEAIVDAKLQVIRALRSQTKDTGESGFFSGERLGPADAVRFVADRSPGGLARPVLRRKAKEIVTTDPKKADKVLDQTIRNLLGRDLEDRNGLLFRVRNTNGHPPGDRS